LAHSSSLTAAAFCSVHTSSALPSADAALPCCSLHDTSHFALKYVQHVKRDLFQSKETYERDLFESTKTHRRGYPHALLPCCSFDLNSSLLTRCTYFSARDLCQSKETYEQDIFPSKKTYFNQKRPISIPRIAAVLFSASCFTLPADICVARTTTPTKKIHFSQKRP